MEGEIHRDGQCPGRTGGPLELVAELASLRDGRGMGWNFRAAHGPVRGPCGDFCRPLPAFADRPALVHPLPPGLRGFVGPLFPHSSSGELSLYSLFSGG